MSTFWGYKCQTCDNESDEWFNHGQVQLTRLVQNYPTIKAGLDALGQATDYTLVIHGVYHDIGPLDWLESHQGHDIVLHNEYNDIKEL